MSSEAAVSVATLRIFVDPRANPSRAYKVRREEPEFARQWAEALVGGYQHLEMETLHRLRMGTGKDDNKFDIANALRLLALHRESVAREKARQSEASEEDVLASLDAKIQALRDHELERAAAPKTGDDGDESA